jgi:hypothetical protein
VKVTSLTKYSSCQTFAASSLKRRISTCRSKGCRMTSNLCTQCWNSEWHLSTGTYSIVTLIISGSASGWKDISNVSITEILLCLFPFWLDSIAVWIYSKFTVANCSYRSIVNAEGAEISLLLYSLYVNIGITSNTVATDWQYVNYLRRIAFLNGRRRRLFASSRRKHLKSLTYPNVWFILLTIMRVIKAFKVLWAVWVASLEDSETLNNFSCKPFEWQARVWGK